MVLRILKMIATSGFLSALECTKFVFGRGCAPNLAGGAYSALPDPLAGLRGLLLRRKEEGRGERKRERERKGGQCPDHLRKFLDPPLFYACNTLRYGYVNIQY